MGTLDSIGFALVPVGEIVGDSLRPLPDEQTAPGYRDAFAREMMAPGSRFTLFAAGSRVGTFTAGAVDTDDSFCVPRPRARGVGELVPAAAEATRFLALPEYFTTKIGYQRYQPLAHTLAQRVAGIDLAAAVIPQVGAIWPPSMVGARADIIAFGLDDDQAAVSTTFVFRDRARVQPAMPDSYSLYLLAAPRQEGYGTALAWYREAAIDGKGIPIHFEHLDWDGDGRTEVLLEVLGERARWNAVVQIEGDEWRRTFEDPCGAAAPAAEGTRS